MGINDIQEMASNCALDLFVPFSIYPFSVINEEFLYDMETVPGKKCHVNL